MVMLDGPKMQMLRKAMNKTQAELDVAADTTERYIRDLEVGRKYDPSARIVYRCAVFLGVAMEELMIVIEEEA